MLSLIKEVVRDHQKLVVVASGSPDGCPTSFGTGVTRMIVRWPNGVATAFCVFTSVPTFPKHRWPLCRKSRVSFGYIWVIWSVSRVRCSRFGFLFPDDGSHLYGEDVYYDDGQMNNPQVDTTNDEMKHFSVNLIVMEGFEGV